GPAFVQAVQAISGLTATKTDLNFPSSAITSLPTHLTAHVTPTPDLGEGTVTFTAGGNPIGNCQDVPVATTGVATCNTTFTTPAPLSWRATFSGDAELDTSTSPEQDLVVKDEPQSTMSLLVTDLTGKVLSTAIAAPGHVQWHVDTSDTNAIVTPAIPTGSVPLHVNLPANPSARRVVQAATT